ncbi:MAG: hypothetical protein AABY22_20225 [Nanoarchaeota archaeon]
MKCICVICGDKFEESEMEQLDGDLVCNECYDHEIEEEGYYKKFLP